jgi:hypothetical protein
MRTSRLIPLASFMERAYARATTLLKDFKTRQRTMTVTDLIKKLRQYEEIGTIASVRIEFGDGSIYNDL